MFWFIMIFSTWKLDCFCFKWLGFDIFFIDVDLIILPWIWHCFFIDLDLTILTWSWHCFFYEPRFYYPDLNLTMFFFYEPGFDNPDLILTLFFFMNLDLIILTWIWHCFFNRRGFDYPDLILTLFLWTWIWLSWLDFDIFCGPGFEYFFGISYGMWGAGDPEQWSWKAKKNAEYKVT